MARHRLGFAHGLLLAACIVPAGCSGGAASHSTLPSPLAAPAASSSPSVPSAEISFRITVGTTPAPSALRRAAFVSPATASVGLSANGGAPTIVNVAPATSNCSSIANGAYTCTVAASAPIGNDTIVATLYSSPNGAGNVLGTGSVVLNVQEGKPNVAFLIVNGVLDHVALALPTASVAAGVAASVPLILTAYDANNNAIVGPGVYSDAAGNALTISLSITPNAPTVQSPYVAGTITASATSFTAATTPLTLSYDGRALLSAQVTASVSGGATVAPASATLSMTPTIYEYAAITSSPFSLAVGPDKQIWVTLFGTGVIEHFVPPAPGVLSLAATSFAIPGAGSGANPLGIAAGEDGNIWIADWNNNSVFYCTLTGSCTSLGSQGMYPHANYLVDGGDGNMYFDESYYDGPFTATTTSHVQTNDFSLGGGNRLRVGPDGRIWGTSGQGGCCNVPYIVALPTATSANQTTTIVSMGNDTTNAAPGPDGNIWYVQGATGTVGHLTSLTATSPSGPTFTVPSGAGAGLRDIVAGPDGVMYFTEPTANKIGRAPVTAAMTADLTEYALPTSSAGLIDIIAGPDGNLWFVENSINKIGKLAL
jgi:streptogramin lyase